MGTVTSIQPQPHQDTVMDVTAGTTRGSVTITSTLGDVEREIVLDRNNAFMLAMQLIELTIESWDRRHVNTVIALLAEGGGL